MNADQKQVVAALTLKMKDWLKAEGGARSTLAGAVVVLDKLRQQAPISREDILTANGQLVGGRGVALRNTLAHYGETRKFLADGVTTRSALKFESLAELLEWGSPMAGWETAEREVAVSQLVAPVLAQIDAYFLRRQMRVKLDLNDSPVTWVEQIFDVAQERSRGRVEQHLVGAKLQKRMPEQDISAHAAFAADVQTQRSGDFVLGNIVFHVTAVPALPVIEKCQDNLRQNLNPVLVVPRAKIERAKGLASATPELERRISFVAIEDFLATNIIEMAGVENSSFVEVLESIVELYNERINQSETDKSLRIDLG